MAPPKKFDIPLPPTGIANQWQAGITDLDYGREQLRFWWLRANSGSRVSLDGWVESFSWDDLADVAPVVNGSITLRQSLVHDAIPPMAIGDQVIMEMRKNPAATWKEQARLRIIQPQRLATGQFTYQLENDAALLLLSKDNWHFPKGKKHPHGWTPWQIVQEVCTRSKIRVVMPRIGKPMKKFPPMKNASAIDVINKALQRLRVQEGKVLIRRYEHGVLYLSLRHYSPELISLGPQLIEASMVEQRRNDYASSLTVRTAAEKSHGKDAKGKKKATHRSIKVNVTRPQFVKRYGYVHAVLYAHGADSPAEVRALALAHLARVLRPRRTLTLTSPYIPGLRRGGYMRIAIPTLHLTQIVYIQSVSHNASPGSLTMDVTVAFDDPQITPPLDRVNANARDTGAKKKKTNPTPSGTKKDAQTAKPPPNPSVFGGIASK